MPETVLFSTAYLPPVSYVSALVNAGNVEVEQWEHYQKQSYRNRCHIAAANGLMALSIPVERTGTEKKCMKDVRVSEHDDWQRQHWKSIVSAYNTTPFFEYYEDDFAPFFHQKWDFLLDFNMALLEKVLELLDVRKSIGFTAGYVADYHKKVVDLRGQFHPKHDCGFTIRPYYQVFQEKYGFLPDLSIVDLLFNMGNEAQLVLKDGCRFTEDFLGH